VIKEFYLYKIGKIATTEVTYKYHVQVEEKEEDLNEKVEVVTATAAEASKDLVSSKAQIGENHERRSSTSSFQSNSSNTAITGDDANSVVTKA
jgi:hypothetical protein